MSENEQQVQENPLTDYWTRERAKEQRLQDWMAQLRVGDEVAVEHAGGIYGRSYEFRTLSRITTQFFMAGPTRYRKKDGREPGDRRYHSRLVEPTPELKQEAADAKAMSLLTGKLNSVRWRDLPLEMLRKVDAVLTEQATNNAKEEHQMRISELDDIEKEVLLGAVIERARADLNDGRPLTEMRAREETKVKLFEVLHDGPSRPIIQTPSGRWLSLSQFNDGRWSSYELEETDCAIIIKALNWLLVNSPEIIAEWGAPDD